MKVLARLLTNRHTGAVPIDLYPMIQAILCTNMFPTNNSCVFIILSPSSIEARNTWLIRQFELYAIITQPIAFMSVAACLASGRLCLFTLSPGKPVQSETKYGQRVKPSLYRLSCPGCRGHIPYWPSISKMQNPQIAQLLPSYLFQKSPTSKTIHHYQNYMYIHMCKLIDVALFVS